MPFSSVNLPSLVHVCLCVKRRQRPEHHASPGLFAFALFFGVMQLYWALEFYREQTEAARRESIDRRDGTGFFYLPP